MPPNESAELWLTVVTVVRDAPQAFAATVASVGQQDLTGVEYVVIDGSAQPGPIVEALSTLNSSVYVQRPPRGIYQAMNEAIDVASGSYLYFLNAGDVFHGPEVLAAVGAALRDHSPLWAFGPVEIVGLDGRRVITPRWDYASEKAASFSRGHFPPHQGTFVSAEALRAQGGFDPRYSIVADYASSLKLAKAADPLELRTVIATFTEGGVSTTRWRDSLRQFHRARRDILRPSGLAAAREYGETVKQAVAMGLYRGVISRVRR